MKKTIKNKAGFWLLTGRVVFTVCLALTLAFIFRNSLAVGAVSAGESGRVLGLLQGMFQGLGMPQIAASITDHIVRKLAHFCEFALEGFWLLLCLRVYVRQYLAHLSVPVLLGLLTALADETLQLFSDGRDGRVTDVWIDFGGVVTGILAALVLLWLCGVIFGKTSKRSRKG